MSKTLAFPNMDQVEQQTANWLSAIDRGLTEAEQAELQAWLSESPVHGEKLVHFASVWDLMDLVAPIAKVLPLGERLDDVQSVEQESRARPAPRQLVVGWLPISGVLATVLVAVLILVVFPEPEDTSFLAVYSTEVGEQSGVMLPDGSELELNTDTEVSVFISDHLRRVTLIRGEAYFDVAKNADAPFVAQVGSAQVVAVGTEFNIEVRDSGDVEVMVTEGKVRVEYGDQDVVDVKFSEVEDADGQYVSVGEKVFVSDSRQNLVSDVEGYDLDVDLAWREGMLIFEGESLDQVVSEINRYTSLDIKIVDDSIRGIEVGGFFRAGDTEQLLIVLENNFGILSERRAGQLLLKGS